MAYFSQSYDGNGFDHDVAVVKSTGCGLQRNQCPCRHQTAAALIADVTLPFISSGQINLVAQQVMGMHIYEYLSLTVRLGCKINFGADSAQVSGAQSLLYL